MVLEGEDIMSSCVHFIQRVSETAAAIVQVRHRSSYTVTCASSRAESTSQVIKSVDLISPGLWGGVAKQLPALHNHAHHRGYFNVTCVAR